MGKFVKKIMLSIVAAALIIGIVGCGNHSQENTDNASAQEETAGAENTDDNTVSEAVAEKNSDIEPETENVDSGNKTLVIYFSATGTTKGVAEKIAQVTGADLYAIVPTEPYSDEDLNYNDKGSRATKEQNDQNVRPEYEDIELDIENDYSTIFLGYPIWWGVEPRIMDTFVESYNFDGITVIPFCTSGSSGINTSSKNLSERAGTGNWLEGNRFSGSASEEDIRSWIDELGLE